MALAMGTVAVDQEQLIRGLLRLAERLSSGLPLELRLTDLCRTTVQLLGCDRSSIFLREGRHYRAKCNHGNPPDIARGFPQFKVSLRDPLNSRAMQTRSFVLVNDAQDSPLMNAQTARWGRMAGAAGCTGYIEKPIDPDTFKQEIEEYLNARPSGEGARP